MFSLNMRNHQLFAVQLTFDLGVLIPRVSPKGETKRSFLVDISRFEPVILMQRKYQPFKLISVDFIPH